MSIPLIDLRAGESCPACGSDNRAMTAHAIPALGGFTFLAGGHFWDSRRCRDPWHVYPWREAAYANPHLYTRSPGVGFSVNT